MSSSGPKTLASVSNCKTPCYETLKDDGYYSNTVYLFL